LFQSSLVPQAECNWLVCTLGRPESLFQACTRPTGRVRYGRNIITLGRWTHFNRHPAHGPGATSTVSQGWAATVSSWATLGLIAHVGDGVCARPSQGRFCMSVLTQSQCLWRAHGNRAVACFRVRPQGAPLSAVASLGPLVKPDAVVSPDLVALCTAQSEARPSNGRSGGSNASSLSIKKK
jgi:hypothetical protein